MGGERPEVPGWPCRAHSPFPGGQASPLPSALQKGEPTGTLQSIICPQAFGPKMKTCPSNWPMTGYRDPAWPGGKTSVTPIRSSLGNLGWSHGEKGTYDEEAEAERTPSGRSGCLEGQMGTDITGDNSGDYKALCLQRWDKHTQRAGNSSRRGPSSSGAG